MPMRDRFFTRRSFAALCAVLWLALPFSPLAEAETMKALTPETVAAHVAARYNDTFGNLYVAWPVDKVVRPLPPLKAGDFRITGETASQWTLASEPLDGPTVIAHVSKAEGLVEFARIVISAE